MAASSVYLRQRLPVADGRQRVQIGDEVEGVLALALQIDVLPDRAEVVAPVESSCRLYAGEYTHGKGGVRGQGLGRMMNDE